MNVHNTNKRIFRSCTALLSASLISCASPTRQSVLMPLERPAAASKITLSRGRLSHGGMLTMYVVSSGDVIADKQSTPIDSAKYCHAKGKMTGKLSPVKADRAPEDCTSNIDAAFRLPNDKYVKDVESLCGPATYKHIFPVSTALVLSTISPPPFCVEGTEIGTLSPGGTLEWLVSPGQITVATYLLRLWAEKEVHSDGGSFAFASQTFKVESGKSYLLQYHGTGVRPPDITIEQSP